MAKKHKILEIILILIFCISTAWFIWYGRHKNEMERNIFNYGVSTVGTVIKKGAGSDIAGRHFSFSYVFYVDRVRTIGFKDNVPYRIYKNVHEGMKFEVKYLPNSHGSNSILYINKPVSNDKGVETTGVLLNILSQEQLGGDNYLIFEFYDWYGNCIETTQPIDISLKIKEDWIGRKYKVRFLPSTPNESAILYIDEPIEIEK